MDAPTGLPSRWQGRKSREEGKLPRGFNHIDLLFR
jgi:hypothetical protein